MAKSNQGRALSERLLFAGSPKIGIFTASLPADLSTQAARDVLTERGRQINAEGWTPERDDKYVHGELGTAAGCYAMYTLAYPKGDPHHAWPFSKDGWKPSKDPRRNRVIACALLLAEIERMDRAAERTQQPKGGSHG